MEIVIKHEEILKAVVTHDWLEEKHVSEIFRFNISVPKIIFFVIINTDKEFNTNRNEALGITFIAL